MKINVKESCRYVKSLKDISFWLTITAACLYIVVISFPVNVWFWGPISTVLGLSIVLWFPGYSLTKILFPVNPQTAAKNEINSIERGVLGVGLSIALVSIVGLLLRFTPWSSDYLTAIILLEFSVILSTVAWIKDDRIKKK